MKDLRYAENAIGHLMLLGPRELEKAYEFSKELTKAGMVVRHGRRRMLEKALRRYLGVREGIPDWWDAAVVRNREAMLTLYSVSHYKPSARAQAILFDRKYPEGSVFAAIKSLKALPPFEAAAQVMKFKIDPSMLVIPRDCVGKQFRILNCGRQNLRSEFREVPVINSEQRRQKCLPFPLSFHDNSRD